LAIARGAGLPFVGAGLGAALAVALGAGFLAAGFADLTGFRAGLIEDGFAAFAGPACFAGGLSAGAWAEAPWPIAVPRRPAIAAIVKNRAAFNPGTGT
jgi:hypothetical protein